MFFNVSLWQGGRDSNSQPMVLETTTLPLSHPPTFTLLFTYKKINIKKQFNDKFLCKNLLFFYQKPLNLSKNLFK